MVQDPRQRPLPLPSSRPGSVRSRSVGTVSCRSSSSFADESRVVSLIVLTDRVPPLAELTAWVCPLALGQDRKLQSSSSFADEKRVVSPIVQDPDRVPPLPSSQPGSVRSRSGSGGAWAARSSSSFAGRTRERVSLSLIVRTRTRSLPCRRRSRTRGRSLVLRTRRASARNGEEMASRCQAGAA